MPLIIDGQNLDEVLSKKKSRGNNISLDAIYPHFKESSQQLYTQPITTCQSTGVLYVNQREYAVTTPQDGVIEVMGSEDATTCHVAVLRHTGSGVTGVAHFDGCSTHQGVNDMVDRVCEMSEGLTDGRLELHLVGGFCDDDKHSERLSKELLGEFHSVSTPIHLKTACITELNSTLKNGTTWPHLYGIGVNVKSGDIFPAVFEDKGPDQPLRGLRNFVGDKMMLNVYDHESGEHRIGPFNYQAWPHAALILQQPDHFIRQRLSTSPAVEPPYFEHHVRQALTFYLHNPDPSTTVFLNGKGHVFKKNEVGKWESV